MTEVIADFKHAEVMLKTFIDRVKARRHLQCRLIWRIAAFHPGLPASRKTRFARQP